MSTIAKSENPSCMILNKFIHNKNQMEKIGGNYESRTINGGSIKA